MNISDCDNLNRKRISFEENKIGNTYNRSFHANTLFHDSNIISHSVIKYNAQKRYRVTKFIGYLAKCIYNIIKYNDLHLKIIYFIISNLFLNNKSSIFKLYNDRK